MTAYEARTRKPGTDEFTEWWVVGPAAEHDMLQRCGADPYNWQVRPIGPPVATLSEFFEAAALAGVISKYEYGRCWLCEHGYNKHDVTSAITKLAAFVGITK